MNNILEMVEKELKLANREIEKIEREMVRLDARLEEYKDRVVMLQDFIKNIDSLIAESVSD